MRRDIKTCSWLIHAAETIIKHTNSVLIQCSSVRVNGILLWQKRGSKCAIARANCNPGLVFKSDARGLWEIRVVSCKLCRTDFMVRNVFPISWTEIGKSPVSSTTPEVFAPRGTPSTRRRLCTFRDYEVFMIALLIPGKTGDKYLRVPWQGNDIVTSWLWRNCHKMFSQDSTLYSGMKRLLLGDAVF